MVMVVGNSRRLRLSKKRKAGTYPLTALALNAESGSRKRFISSRRGMRYGSSASASTPCKKRGCAYVRHLGAIAA